MPSPGPLRPCLRQARFRWGHGSSSAETATRASAGRPADGRGRSLTLRAKGFIPCDAPEPATNASYDSPPPLLRGSFVFSKILHLRQTRPVAWASR